MGVSRRCSEQEPADSLTDKFNAGGGWLPSLTFCVSCCRYMKTPQELHEWVRLYNWDDGLAPMWPIVQSDMTQFATALLIYWRLEGPWFQGGARANEEAERLHALVERRLLEGVYAKGPVRYDPVADNGLSRVQVFKLKQSGLPIQFLEPVYDS